MKDNLTSEALLKKGYAIGLLIEQEISVLCGKGKELEVIGFGYLLKLKASD